MNDQKLIVENEFGDKRIPRARSSGFAIADVLKRWFDGQRDKATLHLLA